MSTSPAKPKIIVVCGPTGIGKTAAAIELAQAFGGEIVSADSMQIYRYMNIGTAKPSPQERAAVRHHMIDVVEPSENFSAAQYARLAAECIANLNRSGKVPLVVGGTGLYIKALVHGLFRSPPIGPQIRGQLREEVHSKGIQLLYERLRRCDPESADRLHPNDTFRILRALEVFESTGMSMSAYQKAHGFAESRFDSLKIGLNIDRSALYERINNRVDAMMEAGFMQEVDDLLRRGYGPELKSMQSIGYRHLVDHLQGKCFLEETLETLKRDTRRYAKRQLTWFGADGEIIWKKPEQIEDLKKQVRSFIRSRGHN
jgi:tRNA dimethylallyltransferase